MALAHTVSGKVEQAYRRGDLFERRRRIMAEWAKFCATPQTAPLNTARTLPRHAIGLQEETQLNPW